MGPLTELHRGARREELEMEITIEDALMMGVHPCAEESIRALYGDRSAVAPLEILARSEIHSEDRMRIVFRSEVMGEHSFRLALCDIVERVLPHYEQICHGDLRPRAAIETARRFALGKATEEDLTSALDAAHAAVDAASHHDAMAAEYAADAAWYAALVVRGGLPKRAELRATMAACAYCLTAAGPAGETVAWHDEREAQLDIVRRHLSTH